MKKSLLTCFLAAGLALAAPVLASVPGLGALTVVAAETEPATAETKPTTAETEPAAKLTGWQQDATGWYYLQNGVRLIGWQELDGNRYYFDANGYRVSGTRRIDGSIYLFRPETESDPGALCRGIKGLISFPSTPDVCYYLTSSKQGITAVNKWVKSRGKYYYSNKKGVIRLGTIKLKKKRYHITLEGRLTSYGKSSYDGKFYYAGKDGVLKTGFQKINNKTYYFDPKTGKRMSGVVKVGNDTYCFRKNGVARSGWLKKGGGKRVYYFDQNGKRASGWYMIDSKKYYFDPSTGLMCTGKQTIDGKTYDFGTSGAIGLPLTGAWRIEVNRKSCFIVVYRGDVEVRAFVCSTAADGVSTPTGTFALQDKLRWHTLDGPSYGQYCSHITPEILFHSVPNASPNDNHSLKAYEYNKLGKPASAGCIRLTVKHAKYLYDNCPIGTKVIISDSVARPKTVQIEQAPKIPVTQNYDPTDPNI